MAGEFTKPSGVTPAVLGTIANPDDYNQNIAGQSKDSLVGIDVDGSFSDFNIGDESLITNGALVKDIKLREGYFLKYYNASGVFQNNVNLGQATESLIGQVELATNAEVQGGTDTERAITPAALLSLFGISSRGSSGYVRIPVNDGGVFDEIIFQWKEGATSTTGDTGQTITFPLAFPNAVIGLLVSTQAGHTTGNACDAWFQEYKASRTISQTKVISTWSGTGSVANGVTPIIYAIGY